MNLNCDEKSLTGEAEPVEKTVEHSIKVPGASDQLATDETEVGIGDRFNMAYSTTTVTKGRGRGVVTFTGMETEVGKIAASTTKKNRKPGRSMNYKKYGKAQPVKGGARRIYDSIGKFLGLTEGTPLQRKLSKVAYILFGFAIILAMVVFGVNRFNVTDEVAIYAISTGIAIIPESLIAYVWPNSFNFQVLTKIQGPDNHHGCRNDGDAKVQRGYQRSVSTRGTWWRYQYLLRQNWDPHSRSHDCQEGLVTQSWNLYSQQFYGSK